MINKKLNKTGQKWSLSWKYWQAYLQVSVMKHHRTAFAVHIEHIHTHFDKSYPIVTPTMLCCVQKSFFILYFFSILCLLLTSIPLSSSFPISTSTFADADWCLRELVEYLIWGFSSIAKDCLSGSWLSSYWKRYKHAF